MRSKTPNTDGAEERISDLKDKIKGIYRNRKQKLWDDVRTLGITQKVLNTFRMQINNLKKNKQEKNMKKRNQN